MKTGPFTPKPGDLFTWHYNSDDTPCRESDQIYSTVMNCWVPITGTNLLIALTDTDIWWTIGNRFIHARVDNTDRSRGWKRAAEELHPRARG